MASDGAELVDDMLSRGGCCVSARLRGALSEHALLLQAKRRDAHQSQRESAHLHAEKPMLGAQLNQLDNTVVLRGPHTS